MPLRRSQWGRESGTLRILRTRTRTRHSRVTHGAIREGAGFGLIWLIYIYFALRRQDLKSGARD